MKSSALVDPLHHMSSEFLQNPYPSFKKIRDEAPVFWSEQGKYWLVTGYPEARAILHDNDFAKGFRPFTPLQKIVAHFVGAEELINEVSQWVALKNPPEHSRIRSCQNKAFTPTTLGRLKPHIQETADRLLDDVAAKGQMELISEYAFVLPVVVIAEMLGVPVEDRQKLREWSDILTSLLEPSHTMNPGKMHELLHANKAFKDYLRPLVEERRKNPKQDLISELLKTQAETEKLTDEELVANCVFMLIAGHETTVKLIGNGVHALLTHPEQMNLLRDNPDLTPHAVEEILRYQSPVQILRRLPTHDIEIAGQKIEKNALVVIALGACNRDPRVFVEPEKFDISRQEVKHLAFGEGIHFCLGAYLARAEADIALRTLFKRFPKIALKDHDVTYLEPFGLRGLKELYVSF